MESSRKKVEHKGDTISKTCKGQTSQRKAFIDVEKEQGKDQSGRSCVFRQKEQQPGAFCSDFHLPFPI
ncbi:hypothetical protein EYF80_016640 [Liparis tanakae]|uniref:Uncharacterized protein n=1 Tax=Liparis tanakae TaxID=230148 RepID=A0A4Z2I762_9TELE|nr:hypothetical protein EYF80_016640 [Liparis tanakae]